jgi:glycosyltransferase involved in cell wall biosynthesis
MQPPFISVVIPVFNDTERLLMCLDRLARQTYPKERFEILVVDNGSDRPVAPLAGEYANVVCLTEATPGSYAARNRALEAASGDVFAFTDSDCLPDENWLVNGAAQVTSLDPPGLIAGRIDIFFRRPESPTWVELYEQEFAFPQRENAEVRHYGATANMFSTKSVFDTVGRFDETLRSGGDGEWGNRVFEAGLSVRYADNVRVEHPARYSARDYFSKLKRTTHGHFALRYQLDRAQLFEMSKIIRCFIPPLSTMARIGRSGKPLSPIQKAKVAGFVMASRYYVSLLRLRLRLFPNTDVPPR